MTTHVATLVAPSVCPPLPALTNPLTLVGNSVTCGDTFLTCSPDHSNFALACCGGSTDACYAVTQCINSYESLALCRSTSGCVSQVYTLTWYVPTTYHPLRVAPTDEKPSSESTAPFCRRWTGGGYSAYGCGTFPAVESISIPFLAVTSGSVAITTTETVTVTVAPSASVSSCAKSVPAGAIAGGVIGGLVVLAAAAVGLMYLLRHKGPTSPPPVPVMAEQAPNSPYPSQAPSSPYRTSHTSGAPLYTGFQEAPAQGRGEWVQ